MKLIDGDKLEKHLDYLIQKEEQFAKKCSQSPNNEFERQRRYCFEANALAYGLCKNVMDYYLVADTQVMSQWISVKDRFPEKDGNYLCYLECGAVCEAAFDSTIASNGEEFPFGEWVGVYNSDTLGFTDSYWEEYDAITHWMPLPEPPNKT